MPQPSSTLVGFGASTMQGVGDPAGGFMTRLRQQLAGRGTAVVNLGIGGNTTRDLVRRLPQVAAHQPCAVVVLLGCNDMPRRNDGKPEIRTTVDEYRANLARIFPAVRGTRSLFVTSFMVDEARVGVTREVFTQYMDAAVAAATAAGFSTWDLFRESLAFDGGFYAPDGLHYNGDGHAFIAARVATLLDG